MPHKVVSKNTIQDKEGEIAAYNLSIQSAHTIARGGNDGFEALKVQVKEFLESIRQRKNECLDGLVTYTEFENGKEAKRIFSVEHQDAFAKINRGQEKAFETVLDLMENPARSIRYYESEKLALQQELEELKKYELREN